MAGDHAECSGGMHGETGVGALLRASRMRLGEDLRSVAQMLCIRYPYLEAIEEGRFSELPGQTYAIGFIRAYSDHLGLDSDEVIRRYKVETATGARGQDLSFPTPVPETGIPGGAIVFVGIVVAVIAYGAWYINTSENNILADLVSPVPERLAEQAESAGQAEAQPEQAKPEEAADPAEQVAAAAPEEPAMPTTEPTGEAAEPPVQQAAAATDTAEETTPQPAADSTGTAESAGPSAVDAPASAERTAVEDAPAAEPEAAPPAEPESAAPTEQPSTEPPAATAAAPPSQDRQTETVESASEAARDPAADQVADAAASALAPPPAEPDQQDVAVTEETAAMPQPEPAPEPEPVPEPEVQPVPQPEPATAALPQRPRAGDQDEGDDTPPPEDVTRTPSLLPVQASIAEPTEPAPPASGGSRIVLRAKTSSWIQVRDDAANRMIVTRLLREGESYEVPDQPGLKLLTGNAGALEVLVDGEVAPSIGDVGVVRRGVILDANRLRAGTAVTN